MSGLPLGLEYALHSANISLSRRVSRSVTAGLRYAFYRYTEPSSGSASDYTAHGVFATLTLRWP